jgi:hypothetical protein
MKQTNLIEFAKQLWRRTIWNLLYRKGEQYAGQEDHALINFIDAAEIWDSSIPEEMLRYTTKHWVFLVHWVKGGTDKMRDKARVSALDIIVYMILLLFWLQMVGEPSIPEDENKNGEEIVI